jgi:hypothetical protein
MVHDVSVLRSPPTKTGQGFVRKASIYGSPMSLAIITLAGLIVLGSSSTFEFSLSSVALGLSYAAVQVLALCLVERARRDTQQKIRAESRRRVSATGLPILSEGSLLSNQDPWQLVLQDVSLAAAAVTLFATVMFESLQFGGLVCFGLIDQIIGEHWMEGQVVVASILGAIMVLVHCVMNASLVLTVSASLVHRILIPANSRQRRPNGLPLDLFITSNKDSAIAAPARTPSSTMSFGLQYLGRGLRLKPRKMFFLAQSFDARAR